MEISGTLGYAQVPGIKPQKPAAPTPPPGGNIENRQPPREPLPPAQSRSGSSFLGTKLNITA